MEIPARAQAVDTLQEGWAALEALLGELTEEEMARPATIGGGEWSAKDLLGHAAFWEELAVETVADWRAGRRPAVDDITQDGEAGIDAANARNQERTAAQSVAEVRARAAAAHAAIVGAIGAMPEEEWGSRAAYPNARRRVLGERLGSVIGAPGRPFGHAFEHLPDLEAYVQSLGRG
jgi:hypothetical protein